MIFTINNHFDMNYNTVTKQTYINSDDKSLKLPFVKVLINNIPHFKTLHADELKLDDSELSVSDNIELSSAVTGAAEVSGSNIGNATA